MDLCWRARRAGYRLLYAPRSVAYHVHSGSSGEWSPQFTYLVRRNHVLWLAKHGRPAAAMRAAAGVGRRAARALRDRGADVDLRVARDVALQLPGVLLRRWRATLRAGRDALPGCNICGHGRPFAEL